MKGSIRLSVAELGVCKHKRPNHIGRTLPWLEVRVANRKIGRCNNLEQDHAGNHTALRMAGWRGVSSSWPEEGNEGKLAFEAGALGENVQLLM